jgi:Methyl-accepting chemotaxis protein (MCP) signalling domain/Four helix bundle sensory module for signal transduction
MKIATKLQLGLAIPTILVVVMAIVGLSGFFKLNRQLGNIYSDQILPIQLLKQISDDYAVLIIDTVNKTNDGILSNNEAIININNAQSTIKENWHDFRKTQLKEDEVKLAEEIESLLGKANQEISKLLIVLQAKDLEGINKFDGDLYEVIDPLTIKIQKLIDLELELAEQERNKGQNLFTLISVIYGLITLGSFIVIPVGLWVINNLRKQLVKLIETAENSSLKVTTSATQIAASGKQLEATMNEQVASTNEVSATSQEISATAQELVKTMQKLGEMVTSTALGANSCRENLDEMQTAMSGLSDATISISSKLGIMSEKANNINTVVTTITKVADQTNLLSLNAAIEAEKAGEYGTGFAVVAREIRRLADQTAVATLEIENMVKELQSAVSTGVMEMDKFSKDVGQSVNDVGRVSKKIGRVIEQVQSITPRFQLVSETMEQQAEGAEQISEAMMQLSEASKQTTEALQDTNYALQNLDDAAIDLQEELTVLKQEI